MVEKTLLQLRGLRPPVRSLILLYWIYSFTGALTGVFTQILLYQKFTSIEFNISATIIFFTGIMAGFCIVGYLASILRLNIKHGFFMSFIVMGATLFLLLYSATTTAAYSAMFVLGLGNGLFWLTIHTFELTETKNGERDFYSSMLSAGNQILSLLGPAGATLLIYISSVLLDWGDFTLLFITTPLFYLLGFFCFFSIRDYRPAPMRWADVVHFLSDKKNRIAQLYLMGGGFEHILSTTVPALAVLFILGTALNVGVYNTLLAIFSALCVLVLAQYRTPTNRLPIFAMATVAMVFATIYFGYVFTFTALVVYTVGRGMLSPVMRVSGHVIDLQTMESIGRPATDFYPTMILRDMSLWIWRSLGGLALIVVISVVGTEQQSLSVGLYFLAGTLILTYLGAHLLIKHMGVHLGSR